MSQYNSSIINSLQELIGQIGDMAQPKEPCLHKIPVDNYTNPKRLQLEIDTLFHHKPLILCHQTQLPKAGDALAHDWQGLPLITIRGRDGNIETLMNVCRHRNTRIINDSGYQKIRSLICPYHHWTYGLDGRLLNIPREGDFKDIDKSNLGLIKIPTAVKHGLVWIQIPPHLNDDISVDIDIDHFLGETIANDLDDFGLPNLTVFKTHDREIKSNWKLVQDAFLDGYHVVRLHSNTVGPYFPDNLALSEQFKPHIRSLVGRNEILELGDIPTSEWDPRALATFAYTLFPNSIIIMHPEYTSLVTLNPISPDRTLLSHAMLIAEYPSDGKALDHAQRSFELIDKDVFQAEDIFVCESAQSTMQSNVNQHLLLGSSEQSIAQFHAIIDEQIANS